MTPIAIAYLALVGRILLLGYERIAVKKLGKNASSVPATVLFFGVGALLLLPFALLNPQYDFTFAPLTILSSLFYSLAFVLYVRSLSEADVSLVAPLYNFNVFFLLLLSVAFLGESTSAFKIMGIILLFYGTSFLNKTSSLLNSIKSLYSNRQCQYMIAASMLLAVGRVIDGFVVQTNPPIVYALAIYTLITIFTFLYVAAKGKAGEVYDLFVSRKKEAFVAGFVNAYSYLFLLVAFTQVEVSIAEPFTLLSAIATVLMAKYIFKEKIRERLIGAVIMVIGACLLFL